MMKRSERSSGRSISVPATLSSTELIMVTFPIAFCLLRLGGLFVDPFTFLFEIDAAVDTLDAAVLAGEVGGLLAANVEAADVAALRPGALERLQALHADEARPQPVYVVAVQDQPGAAVDAAVREVDHLVVAGVDLDRHDGLAPAFYPTTSSTTASSSAICSSASITFSRFWLARS